MYIAETSEPGGQISPRPQNREIVNTKLASLNCHRELQPKPKTKTTVQWCKNCQRELSSSFFSVPRVMRGLVGVG